MLYFQLYPTFQRFDCKVFLTEALRYFGGSPHFFFSSRRRHTISVSAFLLNRSSDLFGPLLEDKLCLIFKLAPSVCRMTFPILASLLVRLVVLLPFQLLRLSLATPSRWTPLALSVFLHCVVALLLTLL